MAKRVLLAVTGCCFCAWQTQGGAAVGWRTDGSGKYLAATPPTKWSADENVVWKTPMPSWSNSTPVIVADRIFVCSEPTTLVCVSLKDGRILWQKTNEYMEMLTAQERAKAQADLKKAEQIIKQIKPIKKELKEVKDKLKKSPDNEQLKTRAGQLKKQIGALEATLEPLAKYRLPGTHGSNGYSTCTPVSDGKHVCVLFGTGTAGCYDLEGNRKWIKFIEKPTEGWGHSASPAIVGDKLLVHMNKHLRALAVGDGKILWEAKVKVNWGTPLYTKVGKVDVVITPLGDIVRVSDGQVLAKGLAKLDYCSAIVNDDVVYFIQRGGKAFRLASVNPGTLTAKALWETKPKKERYYASPIYHEGLIYAIMQKNVFSVIDAATGEIVYDKKLDLGKGIVFPSIALAGRYLFVSTDNGTTIVLKPGREYKEVSKNRLEKFRSCPVFLGKRMYIRGYRHLYCIGK